MNWQKSMNLAMDYMENNLANEIDYSVAAQFMNCSQWEFRRLFSFLTQIPLSEYIRRRRLTVSATDIQAGGKIIDIAQRYGYESPAAFSRAFGQWHGCTPSAARHKNALLKPFLRLTFKLVVKDVAAMENQKNHRPNIIGADEVSGAVTIPVDSAAIHKINSSFWATKGNDALGTTALPLYGAFVSEENHHLFGDITGKKLLELGCGRGHSLQYLGARGADELWGLDIAQEQLDKTQDYLASCGLSAKLICAPMEEDCGLPTNYFDIVYSVYGIGWSTDLEGTFARIASYLKEGGTFIFSWSHPIHKCVSAEEDGLIFRKSYFDESWYSLPFGGGSLSLSDRKLSTYINALAKTGFVIEQMLEESDDNLVQENDGAFAAKAKMLPVTFVIKARKPH